MERMETQTISELKVSVRADKGKGVARKLRRQGLVPGIFYGPRHEPVPLALRPEELKAALDTPKLRNTVIRLVCEDGGVNGRRALVKDIQRHPLSRAFLHVDLMEVYDDVAVRANVPVHVTGHAIGVDLGGTLEQHLREIHIRCTPDKIPASITIDVSHLPIGGSIRIKELPVAQGIEVLDEGNISVVSVVAPRVLEETKPAEEAAEAAGEGEAKPEAKADKSDKGDKGEKSEKGEKGEKGEKK
jgi:large subunit ribosomal protein L25